ncbi:MULTISPECIES: hypothetical protein [Xanthomonas]|uniref:hypothetical protein n=1 Tax=Xanthomonas TaxID=338 RepID=UPI001C45F145|nr:hypothetical protein [Xanthomonas euvesicatoria]MBV6804190.1 hypothetical protein [Xanthomonas campestris pv. lawsoniae]MBV6890056.1 hypothetical protein [Xanthomonas campestris pv. spermacoces]MBV6897639.1 hypothetical protein [Xanthomonas campestris pv. ionidii]
MPGKVVIGQRQLQASDGSWQNDGLAVVDVKIPGLVRLVEGEFDELFSKIQSGGWSIISAGVRELWAQRAADSPELAKRIAERRKRSSETLVPKSFDPNSGFSLFRIVIVDEFGEPLEPAEQPVMCFVIYDTVKLKSRLVINEAEFTAAVALYNSLQRSKHVKPSVRGRGPR